MSVRYYNFDIGVSTSPSSNSVILWDGDVAGTAQLRVSYPELREHEAKELTSDGRTSKVAYVGVWAYRGS